MNTTINGIISTISERTDMSWFAVSIIVITLWNYDRNLLDKLQQYLWNRNKNVGW